ncbi:MAG TPA: hypothetical protein PK597_00890 [Oscillospiraceae bacterium]|nr:hypothetical protein [Oscillospiraceae bacterium]
MKKRIIALTLATALLALLAVGVAAGGSASDPLISVAYLTDTLLPALLGKTEENFAAAGEDVNGTISSELADIQSDAEEQIAKKTAQYDSAAPGTELRLKSGDRLLCQTGATVMLLAGEASAESDAGVVVDATDGTESAQTTLSLRHCYVAGEDAEAVFTIASDTAVVTLEGSYYLRESDAVDYNELAQALKDLGLFRGKDTAFGSGFALEDKPTRIEGLIMFLRLVGEEDDALAFSATCNQFTDVPAWAAAYTNYAYAKGYTKGVNTGGTLFDTYREIGAKEYMTFVLRALGYSDSDGDFSWDTSLEQAATFGCLSAAERDYFADATFRRAQVAYLSYYALGAFRRESDFTLRDQLVGEGVLSYAQATSVMDAVTTARLG